MASIRKRQNKWQVQVRRQGMATKTKSFLRKDDAIRWARQQELNFDKGLVEPTSELATQPFKTLLEKYEKEITPQKKSKESETVHLRQIKRHNISQLSVKEVGPQHVAQFRDDRLKTVSPPTVRKEITLIGSIFGVATREWGLVGVANPVTSIKKPPNGLARERRLTADEQVRFDHSLNLCRNNIVVAAIKFARATAMRRSEILSIKWTDVDLLNCTVQLAMTKNGLPRIVPLSPDALAVLEGVISTKSDGPIFGISPNALCLAFDRVCKRAVIENFHFHDLRHEAISHFFELGLSIAEVSIISGHKDTRILFRYTHLKPYNISEKLKKLVEG
jgi:integrase